MNTEPIAEAIEDRLKADPQLWTGTAWTINGWSTGGITQVFADPATLTTPYVVMSVGVTTVGVQRGHFAKAEISFLIVYQPGIIAQTVLKTKLLDRLLGDATAMSGMNPTYGLHNHKLNLRPNTYMLDCNECSWVSTSAVQPIDTTYATQTITFQVHPSVNGVI